MPGAGGPYPDSGLDFPWPTLRQCPSFNTVQQDELIVDGPLLSRVFRRQLKLWLLLGPLLFGLLLILALLLIPRTYTATASAAIQQSSGGGGALALLGASTGTSKRYLGVLKSRSLAASVERHVQISRLYPGRFRTEDDAVTFLSKSIKPDDNADGLLYIAVTLPGPPKFSLSKAGPRPAQIEAASAQAADDYALALKQYYAASDTDQGAALLRGADRQERQSRADYEAARNRVLNFSRGLRDVDPRSAPASPTDSPGSAVATSGLAALYTALSQVQVDLKAQQTARQTRETGVAQQLNDLSDVPTDDPLLADARQRYTQAQADYTAASRLYGPENPNVVRAQTALGTAQAQLQKQVQGVDLRLTTPNVLSDTQIQALYSRQAVLLRQIGAAQRRLGTTRRLSGEYGRLEAEVQLRLEVLRTTLAEGARVRLDNASALSRMTILDPAFPPQGGEPGVAKLGAVCLLLVVLAFLAAVAGGYLRTAGAGRDTPGAGPVANGTGSHLATGASEAARSAELKEKR